MSKSDVTPHVVNKEPNHDTINPYQLASLKCCIISAINYLEDQECDRLHEKPTFKNSKKYLQMCN